MLKRYLLAPGPTPVPHQALLAMAAPVVHHRTPEFCSVVRAVSDGAQELFGTKQPVMTLACSGTGAMEAALTNTLSPGDRVLVVVAGKFGQRFADIARRYDLEVDEIEVEWGKAVDPASVEKALSDNPETKAVLMQHSETSTTALQPVAEVGRLTADRECLLIVDGITSVGVLACPMDAYEIDVLVTGSQKALMLPPGLGLIALSEKAWRFSETATLPRYYFDLAKARKSLDDGDTTAYTAPVSLIVGLKAVFELVKDTGGWAEAYRRHDVLARATRAGVKAMGLGLLAPECPSPAATGFWVPEGVDGSEITRLMRLTMGVTVAGGQAHLKGRVIRLAHIGYADMFDVIVALSATEMALARLGHGLEFGHATAAAQSILAEMYEEPK